jgi:hypothetical protein
VRGLGKPVAVEGGGRSVVAAPRRREKRRRGTAPTRQWLTCVATNWAILVVAIGRPLRALTTGVVRYRHCPIPMPRCRPCEDLLYIQLQGRAPRAGPGLTAAHDKAPRDGGADCRTAQLPPVAGWPAGEPGRAGRRLPSFGPSGHVDVYESVRPSDITGRLVWHALGAKTIDLINEHVVVELPDAGTETIVLDAQTIEDLLSGKRKGANPKEIEKQITARIARHLTNPTFVELGKRLNALREKYAGIQQSSLDFLRELLELARDTVAAEKAVNETPREEQGKAALTELFESLKTDETPVIVENVVNRIDEVVKAVRFEGWQSTIRGDQEVRKALRYTLYVQFKIRDNDVFEKALGYVREYY